MRQRQDHAVEATYKNQQFDGLSQKAEDGRRGNNKPDDPIAMVVFNRLEKGTDKGNGGIRRADDRSDRSGLVLNKVTSRQH